MVRKYKDPETQHMILDALKFGQCTFFPHKFMGLFHHLQTEGHRKRKPLDAPLRDDTCSATLPRQQSVKPEPLPQMSPSGWVRKQALGSFYGCVRPDDAGEL